MTLSAFYKETCVYWLEKNINSISTDYIDTKDLSYQNVKIGNVPFDFACEKKRAVYAYYGTTRWKTYAKALERDREQYHKR